MSSRNNATIDFFAVSLYQIGIRCLAATERRDIVRANPLYQIGIRCLAATKMVMLTRHNQLYQIGIRCLAATSKPCNCKQYF